MSNNTQQLDALARQARRLTLKQIYAAGSGHPGGSLSAIDLLCQLYFEEMAIDDKRATQVDRDRFILSKGHAAPALYAVLALRDLLPTQELAGFRRLNAALQGHPHSSTNPWIDASTGSLGQGFSAAIGMALGLKHQQLSSRIYVMLGDGELQEGMVWEGALSAKQHQLGNLCAIIDYNKYQSDASIEEIMGIEPLKQKWLSFGWHCIDIDGHDFDDIARAFTSAKQQRTQPTVIIAHTDKGRGVDYMQGLPNWHGSLKLSDEQYSQALMSLQVDAQHLPQWLNMEEWQHEL